MVVGKNTTLEGRVKSRQPFDRTAAYHKPVVVGLHETVGGRMACIVNHKATWEIK